jgi:glycosyltransferase involved in cell wall biosynthesis
MAGSWMSDETRATTLQHMARLGLEGAVRFPGVVTGADKTELLLGTDVLVFPGVQAEGQPYVILEAMAAGAAVVSTPKGAIEDMVADGETGFIVPAESPAAIADAVARLLDDAPLRRRFGAAGRARYLERFTDERVLVTMLDWLAGVARRGEARIPAGGVPVPSGSARR